MANRVSDNTIKTYAKTVFSEATKYGFRQVDVLKLINAIMDISSESGYTDPQESYRTLISTSKTHVSSFPLRSERLLIREANPDRDISLLENWVADRYGRHFLLSCATAQPIEVRSLFENPQNRLGIILDKNGRPLGSMAFLDIDERQKRAELRKLIGEKNARGLGYAEEATRLWIDYGWQILGLQKLYVSTLQTHLRNIQLNESVGFKVEGLLHGEVLIAGERHDVLRMGLCLDDRDLPSS